ncbi:MAG: L-fucokinase [Clostridia bacterium]|nr:L-fucokinase [Clostridia bacterium]
MQVKKDEPMISDKPMTSLFLSQSYIDAWEDYKRSLVRSDFPVWDYVILTASNDRQAEGFNAQIETRRENNLLPKKTHFAVIPDPDGKRVGSGGATLGVIRYIAERENSADFDRLRILVIHSGGDSKRVPQYSALGKLFSPVPHELPDGRSSTLFDEFMISMSTVPGRIREGMLLLSGDVLLLFNPLLIDYSGSGAAAISFKEDAETGKNHGVFLRGEDGNVKKCLQKQSVEVLRAAGAVNDRNCVDIDTGAVIFSKEMLKSLYGLICENGKVTKASFERFVNEKVRLSLYADFLYPLGTDADLDSFLLEKPEGEMCDELLCARKAVFSSLRPYRMKLLRLAPAKFIHFGTSREILALMSSGVEEYKELGWSRQVNSSFTGGAAGYNSVSSGQSIFGKNCYLEDSYVNSGCTVGDNVILSYIDIHSGKRIPSNVVLHGLKQKDGKFVARIYGINDNPKGGAGDALLDGTLEAFMKQYDVAETELWEAGSPHSIWTAKLYPCCAGIDSAVDSALNFYGLMHGDGDICSWKKAERKSLCSGFNEADSRAIIDWDARMGDLVRMDRILKLIKAGRPAKEGTALLCSDHLTPIQERWMETHLASADFSEKIRLYYYVGTALGGSEGDRLIRESFNCIGETVKKSLAGQIKSHDECRIVTDCHTVKLPLRVNWGGGWSDTPPYCNEMGGTVLNAAIKLNGDYPVEVTLKKIPQRKIVFDSRDMDVHGEFESVKDLQSTGDPYDPFALQKAALLACGIIPTQGGDLDCILERLGGGFELHSEVTGVPKGSGLGTSSILAAACVKALLEFVGIEYTEETLYSTVLVMEQIMSTGGGWQDQVGGITCGLKMITSAPGITQNLKVEHIELREDAWNELKERFVLIYTGQRRLARNLLRDVVGRYMGNEPDALFALNEIQKTAALMSFELKRGNIDEFARLLRRHWELSKKLDSGSSNTLIDQIFKSIAHMTDGEMICGAGGGGFLQVVLKKGVTKEAVHERLKDVFCDSEIDVWDCELV